MGQCQSDLRSLDDFNAPYPYRGQQYNFSEMEVYEHQSDARYKLIRVKSYYSYFKVQELIESLKERPQDPSFLSIHSYVGDFLSLSMYLDFPITIEELITYRESEEQIWEMLLYLVKPLAELESKKMRYNSINPKGIYKVFTCNQEYVYKIGDPLLTQRIIDSNFLSPDFYYAKGGPPKCNPYKADVFSLGLVVLYCLGIRETELFYRPKQYDFPLLQKTINELNLPNYLYHVLKQMLNPDEADRPDFQMLQISINNQSRFNELSKITIKDDLYKGQKLEANQEILLIEEKQLEQHLPLDDIKPMPIEPILAPTYKLLGQIQYSNGSYYCGQYFENTRVRDGKGILFTNGQKTVEGTWLNDLPDGDDIQIWTESDDLNTTHLLLSDYIYFRGQIHAGIKQGSGFLRFANGNTFEGHFLDDHVHGSGTYRYANHQMEGTWIDDKFVC